MECPVCHQLDQVQKVSAIVSSGTSNTTSTGKGLTIGSGMGGHAMGGAVGVTNFKTKSSQQSVLASVLAPPDREEFDGASWKCLGFITALLVSILTDPYSIVIAIFYVMVLI